MVSIVLSVSSLSSRRYYWATSFVVMGLLFNPFDPPSLSRSEWMVADVVLALLLAGWFWDNFTNYRKGLLFERFVSKLFPDREWIMVNATKDLHKKFERYIESDANPDFVFRHRASGEMLAVECKYRSQYILGTHGDSGIWWDKTRGERYLQYERKNNLPVCIAIGIGGNPKSPTDLAFIPVDTIQKKYPHFIPQSVVANFRKHPGRRRNRFSLEEGIIESSNP